jgi:hypothetical protein
MAQKQVGTFREERARPRAGLAVKTTSYLTLDNPTPDRALAQRLSADLARRYRALPVAQAHGHITVAMADPNDQSARAAVMDALTVSGSQGAPEAVYIVQGDPAAIDAWLAVLWPAAAAPHGPAVWLWQRPAKESERLAAYAENLAALLAAPLLRLDPVATTLTDRGESFAEAVLLLPCSEGDALGHWLHDAASGPATLLVCQPRWPLRRLLVIVRGDEVDACALNWAARLARPAEAAITALMVAPAATSSLEPNGAGIPALLSPAYTVGRKMQHVAQALADLELDGTLHLRQGVPEVVIREELTAAPYDLAIAGVAIRGGEAQWRLRPLLDRLLPPLACPLLLTGAGAVWP